jgi:hypothetical protein
MVANYKVKPVVNPAGYWTRILIFGGDDLSADICFDNLRIDYLKVTTKTPIKIIKTIK